MNYLFDFCMSFVLNFISFDHDTRGTGLMFLNIRYNKAIIFSKVINVENLLAPVTEF